MKIKVSDYIANFLVEKGIGQIFSVVGGGAMHMNDSFGHHPSINCRKPSFMSTINHKTPHCCMV